MSQSDLARKLGKPRQVINDWLHNRKIPETDIFLKIVEELELIADIFPGYVREKDVKYKIEVEEKKLLERIDEIEKKLDEQILKFERKMK